MPWEFRGHSKESWLETQGPIGSCPVLASNWSRICQGATCAIWWHQLFARGSRKLIFSLGNFGHILHRLFFFFFLENQMSLWTFQDFRHVSFSLGSDSDLILWRWHRISLHVYMGGDKPYKTCIQWRAEATGYRSLWSRWRNGPGEPHRAFLSWAYSHKNPFSISLNMLEHRIPWNHHLLGTWLAPQTRRS